MYIENTFVRTYIEHTFIRSSSNNFPEISKFLYLLQSELYKKLLPAVSGHADSKSESLHHAKKIREVFSLNKPTQKTSSAVNNRVFFGARLKTKIKFNKKQ